MLNNNNANNAVNDYGTSSSSSSSSGEVQPVTASRSGNKSTVTDCIEMWDYVGGIRFRGFVAQVQDQDETAMFVFFDQAVLQSAGDLKAGYVRFVPFKTTSQTRLTETSLMALLELCEQPQLACDRLVVAIDRAADSKALLKDLGWIGFGLATLDDFVQDEDLSAEVTSRKWLFMEMEV